MPSGQSKRTARYHTLLTTWLLETDHSTKLSLPIFYFIWHMDSNPSRTVSVVIVCLTYVSACSSIRTGNSSGSADGFREGADDLGKTSTGNSQESNVRFEAIYNTLWERTVWIHNSVTTQKEAVSGYMILWPLPLRKALSGYMILWHSLSERPCLDTWFYDRSLSERPCLDTWFYDHSLSERLCLDTWFYDHFLWGLTVQQQASSIF